MAAARPLVGVYTAEDASSASSQAELPAVFSAPIRPDVVQFVHTAMAKSKRQPYAVSRRAGHQTSAESWGTGRAVSRIPRVQGGGTQRSGQAAFGNMCRGGRMFAPTKVWRKWHSKSNLGQKRYAVASALAASALPSLVMARGHKVDTVPEVPLVIGGDFESTAKTAKTLEIFARFGLDADLKRVEASRKLRAGKGKMRNRRFVMRRGPLIVYDAADGIERACRNLPGVEACQVDRLNLLQLAPGGHMGRLVVWTQAAFAKLDGLYGSATPGSSSKKGFTLPRAAMANADLARIINSDEVQSVVKPAQEAKGKAEKKRNPLRSLDAMAKLNPYARIHRASEKRAAEARAAEKAKAVAGKRKVPDAEKAKRAEKKARRAASKAFFAQASADKPVEEDDDEEEDEEA